MADASLETMIQRLSGFLGLKRIPQLACIARLPAPIAMGFWKPIIGLPEHFASQFSESQQRVVLLHELAHLKAHDPIWHLAGSLITAACWWHPASWWMQRQMNLASEMAADEASQLVDNGPSELAECLVRLGRMAPLAAENAWMGIVGDRFRSGLGQRVHRLLNPRSARRMFGAWMLNGIMAGEFVLLFSASILIPSWFAPKLMADATAAHFSGSLAAKMMAMLISDKSFVPQNVNEELRS
jgi:hypothetical protein